MFASLLVLLTAVSFICQYRHTIACLSVLFYGYWITRGNMLPNGYESRCMADCHATYAISKIIVCLNNHTVILAVVQTIRQDNIQIPVRLSDRVCDLFVSCIFS